MTDKKNWLEDLEQAWSNAEVGTARVGDLLIDKMKSFEDGYLISTAVRDQGATLPNLRILERAPKPEPRQRAIVARFIDDRYHEREIFQPDSLVRDRWVSGSWWILADDLVDPVELVEMPDREDLLGAVLDGMTGHSFSSTDIVNAVLELLEGER